MLGFALQLAERGLVPDCALRFGIRRLLADRLNTLTLSASERFIESLKHSPVALVPEKANEQHYTVPPEYFTEVLGPHRKYSCCDWSGARTLDQAELRMLELSAERAKITDGMRILDLGCGWGSFSLFAASRFPNSQIVAISNSSSQREFIESEASRRKLTNLQVITADMNVFEAPGLFDRIVSIEMFEHMRNYSVLFERLSRWLKDDGFFFMHIFTHRTFSYPFEEDGDDNWMGRYFFSGGMMPGATLPQRFHDHLIVQSSWHVSGIEYSKTCEAWLENHDARKSRILEIFHRAYGKTAEQWFHRWRLFYLACSELFHFNEGEEWFVTHYLLSKSSNA